MKERVRAIIIQAGKVLLIKRVKTEETYWVLPGGGVETGESHDDAIKRECKEELGLNVHVNSLFLKIPHISIDWDYRTMWTMFGGSTDHQKIEHKAFKRVMQEKE